MSRPKSKPSDLNLASLEYEKSAKKKKTAIHWNDLKNVKYVAEGAHCTVHTAELNGKPVAVKLLKEQMKGDKVAIRDLECEEEIMLGMEHPNVMRLIGSGHADDCTFLVMERLQSTLSAELSRPCRALFPGRAARKEWPLERVLTIAEQLARAMAYAHDDAYPEHQLLHRDLKPDNIGIATDGRVLLFDFGLAKLILRTATDDKPVDMTGNTGSARYMAPEVALSLPYDGKADVHSFSMIVYEMAAHEKPFSGMDLELLYKSVIYGGQRPKLSKQWPHSLCRLLRDCWHPDPNRRPEFCEVVRRLERMRAEFSGEAAKP